MRAVILAAGGGTRLRPLTDHLPKCLVPVLGTPILVNALDALGEIGCTRVSIVVGCLAEVIEARIGAAHRGMAVDYVVNPRWAETNSMFSLHLALEQGSATHVLEGDVYFDPNMLRQPSPRAIGWFVDGAYRESDGSYLRVDQGRIVDQKIVKATSELTADWAKSVGILSLTDEGSLGVRDWLRVAVSEQKHGRYYDLILAEHLGETTVDAFDVAPHRWYEIDTPEDLKNAEGLFS